MHPSHAKLDTPTDEVVRALSAALVATVTATEEPDRKLEHIQIARTHVRWAEVALEAAVTRAEETARCPGCGSTPVEIAAQGHGPWFDSLVSDEQPCPEVIQ